MARPVRPALLRKTETTRAPAFPGKAASRARLAVVVEENQIDLEAEDRPDLSFSSLAVDPAEAGVFSADAASGSRSAAGPPSGSPSSAASSLASPGQSGVSWLPLTPGWAPARGRAEEGRGAGSGGEGEAEKEPAAEEGLEGRRRRLLAAGEPPDGTPMGGDDGDVPASWHGQGLPLRFKRSQDLHAAPSWVHAQARQGLRGTSIPLPHRERIQRSFGRHSLETVRAYLGPSARTATRQLGAEAFTRGESIAFRRPPDLHTAAHEAAHVVQQRAGLLPGGVGRVGDPFERAADAVAARVAAGKPAVDLLPAVSGSAPAMAAVQRAPQLGVVPSGVDPSKQDTVYLVPKARTASGIVREVRTWVDAFLAEQMTAGKLTPAQVRAEKKRTAVGVVTNVLDLFRLDGSHIGTYKLEGEFRWGWKEGYALDIRGEGWRVPVLDNGNFRLQDLTLVNDAGKEITIDPANWLGEKELQRARKDAAGIRTIIFGVLPGTSKGLGEELAWSSGKVEDLKKKLKALAEAKGKAKAKGAGGDEAETAAEARGEKGEKKGETKAETQGESKEAVEGSEAAPLPDKVVRWLDANGAHLNVWVDGAVTVLKLEEGETVDELLERVKAAAKALKDGRDPEKSVEMAEGAEATEFQKDGEGSGTASAVPLPEEQAIPGAKRKANTPAYRAQIINYGPSTTVTGASNRFQMKIDYRPAGAGMLAQVTARMQPINYYWELIEVTDVTPESVKEASQKTKVGGGERKGNWEATAHKTARDHRYIAEDAKADFEDTVLEASALEVAATWPARSAWLSVVGLSTGIRSLGSFVSSFIELAATPLNEQSIGFSRPGDFVVRCVATPRADEDATIIRASSVAVTAVRVVNVNQRAEEVNEEPLRKLESLKKELAGLPEGEDKEALAKKIAALEEAEEMDAQESAAAMRNSLSKKLEILGRLEDDTRKGTPRVQRGWEVRLLDAQLQLLKIPRSEYRKQLEEQLSQVKAIEARAKSFSRHFKGDHFRPHVTLASEENGMVTRMLMMLGQAEGSRDGKIRWVLADITSPKTQQVYSGTSSGSGLAGHQEAIRKAFVDFRENAEYGRGTIAIRLPEGLSTHIGGDPGVEARMRSAPGFRARAMQRLTDLATAAEIAGLIIAGPVGIAIGAVGAVAGTIVAVDRLSRRSSGDRLTWDFDTVMDITSIVGGFVGLGGIGAGGLGRLPRWVNRVERVQNGLRIYGMTEMGAQVIIIPAQLELQLRQIEATEGLSPGERAARRAEAMLAAIKSGAVLVVSAAQMLQTDADTGQPGVTELPETGAAGPKVKVEAGGDVPGGAKAPTGAPEGGGPAAPAKKVPTDAPDPSQQAVPPKKPAAGEDPGSQAAEPGAAEAGGQTAAGARAEKAPTRRQDLESALGDLEGKVQVVEHPTLEGTQVRYEGDQLVVEIGAKTAASRGATAVRQHAKIAKELLRYQGPIGKIRRLVSKVFELLGKTPGYGTQGFESRLEVRKLNAIIGELQGARARIDAHVHELGGDQSKVGAEAAKKQVDAEIAVLEAQLAEHQALVDSYAPGRGFVAARAETPEALMTATEQELARNFPLNQSVREGPNLRIDDLLEIHPSKIQDLKGKNALAPLPSNDLVAVLEATRALKDAGGDRTRLLETHRKTLAGAESTYGLRFDDGAPAPAKTPAEAAPAKPATELGPEADKNRAPTRAEREAKKRARQAKAKGEKRTKISAEVEARAQELLREGLTRKPEVARRAAELEGKIFNRLWQEQRSTARGKSARERLRKDLKKQALAEALVDALHEQAPGALRQDAADPARTTVRPDYDFPFGFYSRGDFEAFAKASYEILAAGLDSQAKTLGSEMVATLKQQMQLVMEGSGVAGRRYDRERHTGHTGDPFDSGRISDYDVAIVSPALFDLAVSKFIKTAGEAPPRTDVLGARDLDLLGLSGAQRALQNLVTDLTGLRHPINFKIYSGEGLDPARPHLPFPGSSGGGSPP